MSENRKQRRLKKTHLADQRVVKSGKHSSNKMMGRRKNHKPQKKG